MIDIVEDLANFSKVYVLDTNIWKKDKMDYAVYSVTKVERKPGINKFFAQLKTNAYKTIFPKRLQTQGFTISFGGGKYSSYKCYDNIKDMRRDYCRILKHDPDKNPTLFKKLMALHPENFV